MDPTRPLRDETFADWLAAMPSTLHWSLAVSPTRLVDGLQDGSLRALWKREGRKLPRVDSGRLELWADGLVRFALDRLGSDPEFRGVRLGRVAPPTFAGSWLGRPRLEALMTPSTAVRIALALKDSARARVTEGHVLIARGHRDQARQQAIATLEGAPPPVLAKCSTQALGILAVQRGDVDEAIRMYSAADRIATEAGMPDRDRFTSRLNLLLCAATAGIQDLAIEAVELLNRCEDLSQDYKQEQVERILSDERAEYTLATQRLRKLESRMSDGTRELIHEIT